MISLMQYVEATAPGQGAFLIQGESGVGKELFAEAIHASSRRKGKFISENIAGLDDAMLHDTLFGHKRNAFTGAVQERKGLVEEAESGTLFLDEIGDLSVTSQVKLLRFLQSGEYRPLGADSARISGARVVLATNKDLTPLMQQGIFRHDLYHRFSYRVSIPPLRERLDDLPYLISHFVGKSSLALNKKAPRIPEELTVMLRTYYFPGNVRELEKMIDNAVSLTRANILSLSFFKEHIGKSTRGTEANAREGISTEKAITYTGGFPSLEELENIFIKEALKKAKGIQSIAARLLGITPSAFSKKLKKSRFKLDEKHG
jgi:transcriptional regulator with GAF, ATPase, and Fis domain